MRYLLQEFEDSLQAFLKENCGLNFSPKQCFHNKILDGCDYSIYLGHKTVKFNNESTNYDNVASMLVSKLIEESKSWILHVNSVNTLNGHLHIYLKRPEVYFNGIDVVIQLGDNYGMSSIFNGVKCLLTTSLTNGCSTLTDLRIKLTKEIVERVIRNGGGKVINDSEQNEMVFNKHFYIGNKSTNKPCDTNSLNIECNNIVVTSVLTAENLDPTNYKRKIKENLLLQGDELNCKFDDDDWECTVNTAVLFNLVSKNLNKIVRKPVDDERSRTAIFALYNYVRLKAILDTFEEKSRNGFYPKLPELQNVDFSLLHTSEEWRIFYDHILTWPHILKDLISIDNGNINQDCRIHVLTRFLQSLATSISSYYSKTQILTEPRVQLLPYIFSRIYLVKAILQVMLNCFTILGIKPLSRM